MNKKLVLLSVLLTASINISLTSCKGRVPAPTPSGSTPPTASPSPSVDPNPQPKNAEEFFKKMTEAGFTKKKEELTLEIKKNVTIKVTAWDTTTKPAELFDKNKAHFKPEIADAKDYQAKGLEFAKKNTSDIYLDSKNGSAKNTILMIKIDPKTFEIAPVGPKGTVFGYDQAPVAPTSTQLLFVPPDVYK